MKIYFLHIKLINKFSIILYCILFNKIKMTHLSKEELIKLIKKLSYNFTKIIDKSELNKHNDIKLSNNGTGSRWCRKYFTYTVIYANGKNPKTYLGDSDKYKVPTDVLDDYFTNKVKKGRKIIGIYIHCEFNDTHCNRTIQNDIRIKIRKQKCEYCDSKSDMVCDHRNDLYNDPRVLNTKTQELDDFQPLCNSCNLRKRQVCIDEKKNKKLYSAKNLYKNYDFEFPWEKKVFDIKDINCKLDTYWYDKTEFQRKLELYSKYRIPINKLVKQHIKLVS